MKRILFVSLMFCWSVLANTTVSAECGNKWSDGAVPCEYLGNYLSSDDLNAQWSAYRGYIYVIGPKTIQVAIRFDDKAIGIIRKNSKFALELDVVDNDTILGSNELSSWSYKKSDNFPSDVVIVKDVPDMDKADQLSLLILHPQSLQKDTTYIVEFYTGKAITKSGRLHLNVSLSVDYPMFQYPLYPNPAYRAWDWTSGWNYFTLELDAFETFQYAPNTTDGVCWVNHDVSGRQLCSEYFAVPVPSPDPESTTPPSPPSNLPSLVTAGTSSSAPNLSATVVIEKHDQSEDTNQQVPLGDLYCGIQTKNTTSVSIGSFANKCILYDGLKAGNDSPVVLGSKTVSGLSGGAKTTTHHSFNVKNPSYYTLYGCTNTGSSPPKETKTSDNCGTRTFLAYGVPDVKIEKVYFQGAGTTRVLGSSFTVVADLANSGDNFHAGKNRKMTVSAELSGCVSTRTVDALEMSDDILEHGASGKTKIFEVAVPPTATPGVCILTIIADPGGELQQEPNRESNRGNNSMAITFRAVDPTPPVPQVPVISVTKVTIVNGSHVYTTEKTNVSIEVKNSGGAASQAMTGRMFYTPVVGGQDTAIGTFSIGAIPAGSTAIGIIPDVLFSGSGEMTTTVCFDSIPQCWNGGNIYVDTVQSPPGGEDEDGSTIMRLYRGMMQ